MEVARPAPAGPLRTRQAPEKLDRGHLGRVLQLTLLAPGIVEAHLDGRQPSELGLPTLMEPFPLEWERQRASLEPQLGSAWADE